MDVAQKIGQAQIEMLGAKGVNILTNVNEAAGQSIHHFHVHVIPRYVATDGFKIEMKENSNLNELNLPAIEKHISEKLK